MISGDIKYIKDIHYQTADDFLRDISYGGQLCEQLHGCIFRGHYSDKYELVPSLLRKGVLETYKKKEDPSNEDYLRYLQLEDTLFIEEYLILENFFNTADEKGLYIPDVARLRNFLAHPVDDKFISRAEKWLPEELWELAALAQHYGLPTRLLDWSYDIFISLYFATFPFLYESREKAREILFDSYKNSDDVERIELWSLDYLYLSEFVTGNKLEDCRLKVIRPSYSGNPNLAAQRGLFSLWQVDKGPFSDKVERKFTDRTPLDNLVTDIMDVANVQGSNIVFYRITLPKKEIVPVLRHLFAQDRTAATLFPGYAGVCRAIDERNRLRILQEL